MRYQLAFILAMAFVILKPRAYSQTSLSAGQKAQTLFQRLTGVPLRANDPRLTQMSEFINRGEFEAAAAIATEDGYFLSSTIASFSASMVSVDGSPVFTRYNDFIALVMGIAANDIDARELLTANYAFEDSKQPRPTKDNYSRYFDGLTNERSDQLKQRLVQRSPQLPPGFGIAIDESNVAGLLTTQAWARSHLSGGTNRRAVERTFKEFLCAPIDSWRNSTLPDDYVRRDVDRFPTGDYATFKNLCRGCHAPMDAMGGAFARFDFRDDFLLYTGLSRVADKMNQNSNMYSEGAIVKDDSWINLLASSQDQGFGWHGLTSGTGLKSFGSMVANSDRFKQCMTRRAFRSICGRYPVEDEKNLIKEIAQRFAAGGYKLRALFVDVATRSGCIEL